MASSNRDKDRLENMEIYKCNRKSNEGRCSVNSFRRSADHANEFENNPNGEHNLEEPILNTRKTR